MRHPHVLVVVALMTLCLFAGCQATAQQRVYNAYVAYDAALNAAVEARKAGLISDQAYPRVELARASARLALDTARARATTRPAAYAEAADDVEAALAQFLNALQEAQR